MIKIIGEDKRINWDDTEFYLLEQLRIVQHVARTKGFDITLSEASEVWEEYSDTVCASFIDVLGCYIGGGVEGIWECIAAYFPDVDDKTVSLIEEYEKSSDTVVSFSATRKSSR